jgi:capsular exopolysaccharide synthesis family protein
MPGEGKTMSAVNLALAAARANPERRILLIDADLRRSQVAAVLGIRSKLGLSELLAGECEVRDVVRRFHATRLAVIPAGGTPEEATQVLASAQMKQFLKAVRDNFDEVYIDMPPALPFADAGILAHQVDGVLLVVRANVTPTKVVNQAVEQLGGVPILGCVLNGAEVTTTPYLKNYIKR